MKMLINSEWIDASDGGLITVRNPATDETIDSVPKGTIKDAERAVQAAQDGKAAMKRTPAHERSAILNRAAAAIERDQAELSVLLARENGKPVRQTREELSAAVRIFRGFAEEARRIFSRTVPLDAVPGMENHFAVTIRQPLGVVAAIVPFNYPVELYAHKAAAALAGGNAVIAKPPSQCPLALLRIARLLEEAGLPKAAHQMLTGPGEVVGDYLARSAGVNMITVTGSTSVGIRVSELAAATLKRVHLELGGNDPMIIFADADLEKAAEAIILGRLARGNGQICCAVKRVFVAAEAFDRFADLLTRKTKALKMGDPLQEDTDVGPLISEQAARQVEQVIQEAVRAGAKLRTGGRRKNAFIEPTVLTDIPMETDLFSKETFGPVVPLVAFDSIDQAIRLANDSPFGLQAAVFTNDVSLALDTAHKLEAGGVIVNWSSAVRAENLPFGGVKSSGHGRESIHDTLQEMTEQKTILIHNALSVFGRGR